MKLNEMSGNPQITDPEEWYQEILLPSGIMNQACEIFPDYNSSQSLDASDWIVSQIERKFFKPGDPVWENMRDEVHDQIVAGLT